MHPAWGAKEADCEKYKKTFCPSFLARMKPGVRCEPGYQPECLWDMDCGERESCNEGTCVEEPPCMVNAGGVWYGPYYYKDTPQGIGGFEGEEDFRSDNRWWMWGGGHV